MFRLPETYVKLYPDQSTVSKKTNNNALPQKQGRTVPRKVKQYTLERWAFYGLHDPNRVSSLWEGCTRFDCQCIYSLKQPNPTVSVFPFGAS